MSANKRLARELLAQSETLKAKAMASGSDADIAAMKEHAEKLKAVTADLKREQALKASVHDDLLPGDEADYRKRGSKGLDLAEAIRAKGGFDVSNGGKKVTVGTLGAKALMSTPTDAAISYIGLAGYGLDDRFAYNAFPSGALGSALSVDTLVQSARSLATPSGMDVALGGSTAKPESTVGLTRSNIDGIMIATVTEPISTAHWALPDISDFVRSELGYAVGRGVDDYLVAQITGASGTQTRSQGTDTVLATYRKAIADAKAEGFSPDAILVNPADAVQLDLSLDAVDRFYGNGPAEAGFGKVWGVKVVESNAVTAGLPVVIDTTQFGKVLFGALSFGLNPYATADVDLWTTNRAIGRLETPMLVAVQRPKAVVEITLA